MPAASSSRVLRLYDEWTAHDPFGEVKPSDADSDDRPLCPAAPRGGYASFRVLVQGAGPYTIAASGDLPTDIYRVWYHRMADGKAWIPDALIPHNGGELQVPDADNDIPGQTSQEFWVDIFAPQDASPGKTSVTVEICSAGKTVTASIDVEVLDAVLPEKPSVVMDHNSYGCRWLRAYYPKAFQGVADDTAWHKTIAYLHNYYRLIHEHRGHFSNLGFGHSGSSDPIYTPHATGRGRGKDLQDWDLYDEHYGPLLNGSVFASAAPGMPEPRMPAKPIWGLYTPFTPDWPASYLWWGEEGYEVEFKRCLAAFDKHLKTLGPSDTRMWFFFNHKKRYRWFEWDGDEPKYAKDDTYHLEMGRLLWDTVKDSSVNWVYRMDASWQMQNEFDRLAGSTNFWVCGGFVRWYPEEVKKASGRGDTVWWYGGAPSIDKPSGAILENVYKTWARGLGGFCSWLTTNPGPDPWFNCNGAATGLIYPGERFGIDGPIPSIRLKIQRNGIQDIDLLPDAARNRLINNVGIAIWEDPPPAVNELPPEDWDNHNLTTNIEPGTLPITPSSPGWWAVVRSAAQAKETL